MRFHYQIERHDLALGTVGDCYRTCIACLLNLEPADVPHFVKIHMQGDSYNTTPEMDRHIQSWLAERGLTLIDIPFQADLVQDVYNSLTVVNGMDFTYLVTGRSPFGTAHTAIYRGDKLLWDPSPDGYGITHPIDGFVWIGILASLRCRVPEVT